MRLTTNRMSTPLTIPPKRGSSKKPQPSKPPQPNQSSWSSIIREGSRNPLAIFALIVLAVEAMLGTALFVSPAADRFHIILVMVAVLTLVIASVLIITIYRPRSQQGESVAGISPYRDNPLREKEKSNLIDINKRSVVGAESPPLSDDGLAREVQQLRLVLHQAQRYSTPTYYLDTHLSIIHWNVAFDIIFKPILAKIHRRHVNYFIAELANHDAVFDHARDFTQRIHDGELPLVDVEPLIYNSKTYGMVEFEKVASQLTDTDADLKAWAVALLPREIDWDMYRPDLLQRLRDDKLWSLYAVSYDIVLSEFTLYQKLIEEVIRGVPPDARRVLELGAGTGNVTKALLKCGYRVTAVENNPSMLEKMSAKRLENTGRLSIIINSVDNLDLVEERNFDAVVAVNVIYALDDPFACFRKVAQSLKRRGVFAFSTTHSETSLDALLAAIEGELKAQNAFNAKEEHYRRVVAINRDIECTTAKRYSKEQYVAWLEEAGFEVVHNFSSYKGAVVVIHACKV
jgi:2-polyprenyl-3-methyl-5-hydroxy-6-metoxy-1,4-benzoquinol methylase